LGLLVFAITVVMDVKRAERLVMTVHVFQEMDAMQPVTSNKDGLVSHNQMEPVFASNAEMDNFKPLKLVMMETQS